MKDRIKKLEEIVSALVACSAPYSYTMHTDFNEYYDGETSEILYAKRMVKHQKAISLINSLMENK